MSNIQNENRVWIELEKPKNKTHADEQCRLANIMLNRLSDGDAQGMAFWYSELSNQYCITTSKAGTYLVCADRGHWFNLDHFGRPL